jgi:hypothetical protein
MISMHVPTFSPFVPHLTLFQNSVLSECQSRLPKLHCHYALHNA